MTFKLFGLLASFRHSQFQLTTVLIADPDSRTLLETAKKLLISFLRLLYDLFCQQPSKYAIQLFLTCGSLILQTNPKNFLRKLKCGLDHNFLLNCSPINPKQSMILIVILGLYVLSRFFQKFNTKFDAL